MHASILKIQNIAIKEYPTTYYKLKKYILPFLVELKKVSAVPVCVTDPLKLFVLEPPNIVILLGTLGLPSPLGFAWANIKQRNTKNLYIFLN